LGLCEKLKIADCPPRSATPAPSPPVASADLPSLPPEDSAPDARGDAPRLELLAATAGGAPNVMSMNVVGAEPQAARELDDNAVIMHFGLAQKLLYGRGEHKAVGIVVQLHRTEDLPRIHARLASIFAAKQLDLEIRDFADREPFYRQAVG